MKPQETDRNQILRKILSTGIAGTQDEICEKLKKEGFEVTQSTISRGLRKLGAIKAIDESGRTVYRLPIEVPPSSIVTSAMNDLISNISSNGSTIVIHTTPGSASLIARHLDLYRPGGLLGTIAGDDTIFVAPASSEKISSTIQAIKKSLTAVV